MIITKQSVGIDVSKDDFYVRILRQRAGEVGFSKHRGVRKFDNTKSGFKQFEEWLCKYTDKSIKLSLVMEATGVYHEELAYFLHTNKYLVTIELPTKVNAFAKSHNLHTKTDIVDADVIARLGIERELNTWVPPSKDIRKLKSLTRLRQGFTEDKTVVSNRLHAVRHSAYPMPEVIKYLEDNIAFLKKKLSQIERSIKKLVKEDSQLKKVINLLISIPGVALTTASAIASETGCFQLFESRNQLVKYAGMDIVDKQSGSSVKGKSRMSKRGNSRIRRALYMPSIQFTNKDNIFGRLYQRVLERTGLPMKALVAVQRKLLIVMYGVVKNGMPYDPEVHLNRHKKGVDEPKLAYSDSAS
jgi:transposase